MPRVANAWKIEGLHPAEYATQWGSTDREGAYFYNVCAQDRRDGGVTSNPDWGREEWEGFVSAVSAQRLRVFAATRTAAERKRTGWSGIEVANLQRLEEWGRYMLGRAVSSLPWLAGTV
jgi:hypothetical protein